MIKSIKTILSQDKEKFVVPKKVQDQRHQLYGGKPRG